MASLLSGCDIPDSGSNRAPDLDFEEFLTTYSPPVNPDPVDEAVLPGGSECTVIQDEPPFEHTIELAIDLIRTQVDADLAGEAMGHLEGGIRYHEIRTDSLSRYSALYRDRTILLFDSLFSYGCVEDVASTLLHEMVHAVQMDRHLGGNLKPGGFNVTPGSVSWLDAELMAEAYQIRVSRNLGWLTENHASKILRLHNQRRSRIP